MRANGSVVARGAALIALSLAPSLAWAQQTAQPWANLGSERLATVYVLDDTGTETGGTLVALDDTSIVIRGEDGTDRRFEAARVKRLSRRGDSLKNGALYGAIVGAGAGLATMNLADCVDEAGGVNGCGAAGKVALFLISTGIYAAIGTAIDALIPGRTTIYVAPPPSPAPAQLGPNGLGIGIQTNFRW